MNKTMDPTNMALGKQIILFLFVGAFCYGVDIILLYLFVDALQMEVNMANFFSSTIAIYVAYILNRRFIFDTGKHSPQKEITMFFVFSFVGLMLNMSMMYGLTTYMPWSIYLSKTLVTLTVAAFNFTTRKLFVFNG